MDYFYVIDSVSAAEIQAWEAGTFSKMTADLCSATLAAMQATRGFAHVRPRDMAGIRERDRVAGQLLDMLNLLVKKRFDFDVPYMSAQRVAYLQDVAEENKHLERQHVVKAAVGW